MNTKKKLGRGPLPLLLLSAFLFQCNKAETETEHHAHTSNSMMTDMEHLIAPPNKIVLSRQAIVKLSTPLETAMLKAQGYIDLDRSRNQTVSARFGGRIENLYVTYELQYVKKDDKILDLYSPEINTYQEEHLFLLKSTGADNLLAQSRQKLKLFGITENQISRLEKSGTFVKTITVYSPANGYVFFNTEAMDGGLRAEQKTSNNKMNMTKNMNETGNSEKPVGSSTSQIREGMYINKGEPLFMVNDLKTVWAIVSVPSENHPFIKEGKQVTILSEFFTDKPLTGVIALVEQTFEDTKQRFVRIRVALPNPSGELKINSLITAEIKISGKGNFQIPVSSVHRTGLHAYVWVRTGTTKAGAGIFELRQVTTSAASNGMVSIISGLSAHEEVAAHAGYLADSETFLNNN